MVALSEAEQFKLATKRSKKDFHISYANGLGDGVNNQSKVLDKQVQKTSGTDKGTGIILRVLDVPPYKSESYKESWGDSKDKDDNDDDGDNDDDAESDDHDDDSNDKRTESDSDENPDPNLTNVDQTEYKEEDVNDGVHTPGDEFNDEEKFVDEETMDDEEDDEVLKDLYKDVNVNLEKGNVEMTDANQRVGCDEVIVVKVGVVIVGVCCCRGELKNEGGKGVVVVKPDVISGIVVACGAEISIRDAISLSARDRFLGFRNLLVNSEET
nr:hypothetical protein [Tanacetum cinerariifolium]